MFADSGSVTILVALGTAVVVSILAPLVAGWVTNKGKRTDAQIRKAERDEDNARQDKIAADALSAAVAAQEAAANAATAAQRLMEHQKTQQAELLTSNNRIAKLTEGQTVEIAQIKANGEKAVHLADGAYTAAKRTERWALAGKLSADRLLIAYKQGTSMDPTAAELAAVQQGEQMVSALDTEIAAREAALERADIRYEDMQPPGPKPKPKPSPGAASDANINIENATIEAGVVTVQPKDTAV